MILLFFFFSVLFYNFLNGAAEHRKPHCNCQARSEWTGLHIIRSYPNRSVCFFITIIRDASHALSAPLLPEGDESGLRDLSHNGGQMFLAVATVPWRRGLWVSISTITASDHRLTLEETQVLFSSYQKKLVEKKERIYIYIYSFEMYKTFLKALCYNRPFISLLIPNEIGNKNNSRKSKAFLCMLG